MVWTKLTSASWRSSSGTSWKPSSTRTNVTLSSPYSLATAACRRPPSNGSRAPSASLRASRAIRRSGGSAAPGRHRQALDEPRRQMPAHQHPGYGIQYVTVEQRAQKVLLFDCQGRAQTEQRVRGDNAAWNDCGDERQPITDARDVAIGEPLTVVPPIRQQPRGACSLDAALDRPHVNLEGLQVFSFDDGQPAAAKVVPILGRVQFPPEPRTPSAGMAERRMRGRKLLQQIQIVSASQIGDAPRGSADEPNLPRGDPNRPRARAFGRGCVAIGERGQLDCRSDAESRANLARRLPGTRDDSEKPKSAMNGEERLGVVESDDGINRRAIDQRRSERRAAPSSTASPHGRIRPTRPPLAVSAPARVRGTVDTD